MDIKQKTFSPKQVARAVGVSEASIKRWCDKGILPFSKTAGGHRRLSLSVVLDFIKENDNSLTQPEVLGLPAAVGSGVRTLDQACKFFETALEQGNETLCKQVTLDMCLAGHDMATIADQVIAPAFHALGDRWQHGDVAVYQERRGIEITREVLQGLKETLHQPDVHAPVAIGASLSGDPYSLPGLMGELALLEVGWRARFLGCDLPFDTVSQAVQDLSPRMVWLSVSSLSDVEAFTERYADFYALCAKQQCAVVVGGSALTESIRQNMSFSSFGDHLKHLQGFAQSLYQSGR